jgi:hypothetical protein
LRCAAIKWAAIGSHGRLAICKISIGLCWASEHRLFVLDIESNWIFYLSGNCPAAVFNADARIKTGIKIEKDEIINHQPFYCYNFQ